ncbi:MAG: 50S ribosomal protein L9 [Elusimicrobia bacterium]|nr:50S ribosomal protein L9 [Candidatus Liberimonas magnetica]
MKVILKSDILNVGKQGDIKNLSSGYVRNYLVPKNLALEATPQNLKIWEKEKVKLEKQKEEVLKKARELAERIEKTSITISVKVGETGKLFGSVTSADIVKVLNDNGFSIDKQNVLIEEPFKEIGVYAVDVKVHPEVIARPKVWIVEEKEATKEEKS